MRIAGSLIARALLPCLMLACSGCTTARHLLKAKPVNHSAFLRGGKDLKADAPDSGPFHYSARTMSMKTIRKDLAAKAIWIAPIDLGYLRPTTRSLTAAQERQGLHRPVREIADKLWLSFYAAFAHNPASRYRVVRKPVKGCVELHLAMVQFDQTNGAGNVAKTMAGTFVGPLAMVAGPFVKGTIAIEGRLVLHDSGEVLYEFADCESDPITVLSVRSYQGAGFAERAIEDWAMQFEKMTRMYQIRGRVPDSNLIRLNPF